ncbi:MAG: hypothetical protein K2K84_02015, partial [Muribaculaceae bacterium]|nr:hypothetical protein [Muribaculaceae bacterium]
MSNLVDRSQGVTFNLNILGKGHPDEATWTITNKNDRKISLSGSAKIGSVNLSASMLKGLPLGQYTLSVSLHDKNAAAESHDFTLYDITDKFVPTQKPFMLLDEELTGSDVKLRVGIKEDNTYLWLNYRRSPDSKSSEPNLTFRKLNRGWHEIPIDLTEYDKPAEVVVNIYSANKSSVYKKIVKINSDPRDSLSISCESFRDNLTPGANESWQFIVRRNNTPVQAAVFLNMMNNKLLPFLYPGLPLIPNISYPISNFRDYIYSSSHSDRINTFLHAPGRFNRKVAPFVELPAWRNVYNSNSSPKKEVSKGVAVAQAPAKKENVVKEAPGNVVENHLKGRIAGVAVGTPTIDPAYALNNSVPGLSISYSTRIRGTGSAKNDLTSVELREPKVYTALWEPMLTTGEDGRVDVSFTVPGESTGWQLYAEAWTTDLLSARLTHSFTATKPVVVAPNPPRFVRVGDMVNLVAAVTNSTDSVMNVSVQVVVEADSVSLADVLTDITLAAGETRFVNTPVSVDVTGGQLVYTIRASNGVTGDGERNAIPVLPSTALVTESHNFYLNPGQSDFSMSLPTPEGTDFASELHFTSNPMWSVVEALPSAIEPWCDAATALAMSVYSSRTALELSKKFPGAKEVIDLPKAKRSAKDALKKLKKLQTEDGGFKWGEWADEADRRSTLAVLDWLAPEKDRPEVAELVGPALDYVDKTAVGKDGKVVPDFFYTVVRSFYGRPNDQNGSRVINTTIKEMLSNWKKYSIDQKALAVIALKNLGYQKIARTILGSLRQFGRLTDDRGFEFPNMPNILAYTHTLEAFATADPKSDISQRIIQHLLYIRQGMDWGSSAFTSYAFRSIMTA